MRMREHPALKTLGTFELAIGDSVAPSLPTRKARALVAFLVANRGRDISRERLLEVFWSDFETQRAREGLRTALSSIRHALRATKNDPDTILLASKSVVRWIDTTDFDAERFVELSERDDLASLESAVQLYGGDFLEGGYEEWAVSERERLSSAYEKALAKLVALNKDARAARLLLERNPYNEDAYASLIDAELAADRPTAASELLERYRVAMAQIGSDVSAAFEQRFSGVRDLPTDDEQIALPFVARAEELQRLARAFKEQAANKGFVQIVIGELGIGKTALLTRANEKAREAGLRVLTVRGSNDPRPLASWRGLYQRQTERNLDDNLAAGAREVAHTVARDTVEAFGKPTVLFVDDAQALTGDSFATFAQIARIAVESGHGVIAAARPEARERIETALSGAPYEVITLHPLERADVRTAIALTIDSVSSELMEALYVRSGGNPLFLVSLLQSLVQGEAARSDRGRWRMVRPPGEHLALPRELRTLIEARLNAVGDGAAVVACALALEPSATAEDLAAALDYSEPGVLDALDELTRYGLICAGTEGAQFDFVHDLLREASGLVLNPGRRVALHRAFARRFASSNLSEPTVRLARHLQAAGLNVPAAQAYLRVAQAALARHAYFDAIESCIEGARTVERVPANHEINEMLSGLAVVRAQAALQLGEADAALEAADEAVRQAQASESAGAKAQVLNARALLHGRLANRSNQLSDAMEAAQIAGAADEPRMRALALVEASEAMLFSGATSESEKLAREARAIAKEHDGRAALWAATARLLKIQVYQWHFDAAAQLFREASAVAERVGKPAQSELHCIQAAYDYLTDRLDSATENAKRATRNEPSPLVLFTGYYLQGVLARERGDASAVFAAVTYCRSLESIAKLPPCAAALSMLEVDALLQRGHPGDREAASDLAASLTATTYTAGLVGWSDCPELTRARLQRTRLSLRIALDALEENTHRLPLDCDRAFARLAATAQQVNESAIRDRANERSSYYRAVRVASAAKAGFASIPLVSR